MNCGTGTQATQRSAAKLSGRSDLGLQTGLQLGTHLISVASPSTAVTRDNAQLLPVTNRHFQCLFALVMSGSAREMDWGTGLTGRSTDAEWLGRLAENRSVPEEFLRFLM